MIADRQTHTRTHTQAHRHAHHKTPLPYRGRINNFGSISCLRAVRQPRVIDEYLLHASQHCRPTFVQVVSARVGPWRPSCRVVSADTSQHQPDITSHYRPTQRPVSRSIIDTLRMVCGAAFTKLSGVRLSVCRSICPSRHSPAARRTAANASSVTVTAAVTQACILFAVLCRLSVCLDGPSDVCRQ